MEPKKAPIVSAAKVLAGSVTSTFRNKATQTVRVKMMAIELRTHKVPTHFGVTGAGCGGGAEIMMFGVSIQLLA